MMQPQDSIGPRPSPDWLCRLAAHDSYGARLDWQCLCADLEPSGPGATRNAGDGEPVPAAEVSCQRAGQLPAAWSHVIHPPPMSDRP